MSSVSKMTTRPIIQQNDSNIRGLKGNNELYIGGAVSYQNDQAYGRMGEAYMKETDRGQMNPYVGGASETTGHMIYMEPNLHVTNRDETQVQPLGIASNANQFGQVRNAQYNIQTQRGQTQDITNVRGVEQGHIIATGYNTDPTNRENVAIHGGPVAQTKSGTTELDAVYSMNTGKEATHQSYTGPINGGVAYKAGMSYNELMNYEGYTLRSVTDENRIAGPQKINLMNQDPNVRVPDLHLREEKNTAREGTVTPSNPSYGNIGTSEITPNKIEYVDDRLDPALVQTQLEQNPLRKEGNKEEKMKDILRDQVQAPEQQNEIPVY